MKHNQNARGRIAYSVALFIIFVFIAKILNLNTNKAIYGLFTLLILSYYIFDVFTLREKYSLKKFFITSFLDIILFFVLLLFYKKKEIISYSIVFVILQNVTRYILEKFYQSSIKVIILGDEKEDERIKKKLLENSEYNYIGCVSDKNSDAIGKLIELEEIVEKYDVNEIIYVKELEEEIFDKIFKQKFTGKKVIDSEMFLQDIDGKIDIDKATKTSFLEMENFDGLTSSFEKRIKRILDIFMAIVIFIIGLPLMIVAYIVIKLENPKTFLSNSAFFKQKRIGLNGEIFEIIKFRSMKLHDPKVHSKYASETDERITSIGKGIRKTRIDELPQLINVLKGEMSFVGPRPEWDELGREYEKKINMYYFRYAVKPGLTGWAQVMYPYGANIEDAKRKLEYDLYYIKHQDFVMDVIILFKTVKVVLFRKGL